MGNWPAIGIRYQMPFGNIGGVSLSVDKDVIPGAVLGGATYSHSLVPLVRTGKYRIDVVYDTTVASFDVADQLPDVEVSFLLLHLVSILFFKMLAISWLLDGKTRLVIAKVIAGIEPPCNAINSGYCQGINDL